MKKSEKIQFLFQYARKNNLLVIRRNIMPSNMTKMILSFSPHYLTHNSFTGIFSHKHSVIILRKKMSSEAYFYSLLHELIHFCGRKQIFYLAEMVKKHLKNIEPIAPHPNYLEEFICRTVECFVWKELNQKIYKKLKENWERDYKNQKRYPNNFHIIIKQMIKTRFQRVEQEILLPLKTKL